MQGVRSFAGWIGGGIKNRLQSGASETQVQTVQRARASGEKAVIVLVGTTGTGKSTVANFLVDPHCQEGTHEAFDPKPVPFKVGASFSSQTQSISSQEVVYDGVTYVIVDTPGFQERQAKDVTHTIGLLRHLQDVQKVAAIVFCQRSFADGGKFEKQSRELVEYLKKVFGTDIMDSNLVLLVTGRSGVNQSGSREERAMLAQLQQECKKELQLGSTPPIVAVNGVPVEPHLAQMIIPEMREKMTQASMAQREKFFRIVELLPLSEVSSLQFPKPPMMVQFDKDAIGHLEELVREKQRELKGGSDEGKRLLAEIEEKNSRLGLLDDSIQSTTAYLDAKDTAKTDVLIDARYMERPRWSFDSSPLVETFTEELPISNTLVKLRDTGDGYRLDQVSTNAVKVSLYPDTDYLGRTAAQVSIYTTSRAYHADSIAQAKATLKQNRRFKQEELSKIEEMRQQSEALGSKYTAGLQKQIEELIEECAHRKLPFLTVDEAVVRLAELNTIF